MDTLNFLITTIIYIWSFLRITLSIYSISIYFFRFWNSSNTAIAALLFVPNAKISDYDGVETISIVTKNIDKAEEFFEKLSELKLQSNNIQIDKPEYFITNIEKYKKDMVVDASRNAEVRAVEMLKVNNNEIGGLKNISQGQFEVLEDTEDVKKINENESNQIYKKMRVVVTATYLIKY